MNWEKFLCFMPEKLIEVLVIVVAFRVSKNKLYDLPMAAKLDESK
jgi:hypothetical protein